MESLAPFFSLTGRLAPRPFALAVVIVYVLSFLSQVLISPPATVRWGVWAFLLVQIPLTWTWFTLHAKRLRDAGHVIAPALAMAVLYALAMILLMLLIEPIFGSEANAAATEEPRLRFADLWIVPLLFAAVLKQAGFDFFFLLALVMLALILIPIFMAVVFSIWTGTRPRTEQAATP